MVKGKFDIIVSNFPLTIVIRITVKKYESSQLNREGMS